MTEKQLPELYPGWKTVRRIGSGTFGTVYEIERDLFGKIEQAALKCISIPQNESDVEEMYSNGYDDASITAHFENHLASIVREYSLMAEMKGHTNVVYCDDIRYVPRENGIGWDITIKMELLTALPKTLGPEYDEGMVLQLGMDICRALVLCRDRGIVHRDIKPQNIFVSNTGAYKLGDFGIAKTVERTSGGTKIGTYSYMAPEVYHNKPYGSSADLYSLGLVMYWLLNERRLPFLPLPPQSPTFQQTETARHRRLMGEALPVPKNGSEALKQIVLRACAFDPEARYESAQAMLDALADLEQHSSLRTADAEAPLPSPAPAEPPEDPADRTIGLFFSQRPTQAPSVPVQKPEMPAPIPENPSPEPAPRSEPIPAPQKPAPVPVVPSPEPAPRTEATPAEEPRAGKKKAPRKKRTRLLLISLAAIVLFLFFRHNSIRDIRVYSSPDQNYYELGDDLNTDGLVLEVTYRCGRTELVYSGYECSPSTFESSGWETVNVSYKGHSDWFEIYVDTPEAYSLEIESLPYKTTYQVGELLNPEGLTVRIIYENGFSEIHTRWTLTTDPFDEPGEYVVEVYSNDYENLYAEFTVTVE